LLQKSFTTLEEYPRGSLLCPSPEPQPAKQASGAFEAVVSKFVPSVKNILLHYILHTTLYRRNNLLQKSFTAHKEYPRGSLLCHTPEPQPAKQASGAFEAVVSKFIPSVKNILLNLFHFFNTNSYWWTIHLVHEVMYQYRIFLAIQAFEIFHN
jgi:hypothetical protein